MRSCNEKTSDNYPVLLISAGVPWRDERFVKDLNRWREVESLKGSDRQVLARLLASDKAFRSLYLYRLKKRLYRGWVRLLYPRWILCTSPPRTSAADCIFSTASAPTMLRNPSGKTAGSISW